MTDVEMIENRTFAEIKVGDTASVTRTLSGARTATTVAPLNTIAASRTGSGGGVV